MTNSRQAELREMLATRRHAIEERVQQKIREFRECAGAETCPPTDLSDDPPQEDLDFALVEIQAQLRENITDALARLDAGNYGICDDCGDEIPEKRLRALPFATRCLSCQESAERIERRERRMDQDQAVVRRFPMMDTIGL